MSAGLSTVFQTPMSDFGVGGRNFSIPIPGAKGAADTSAGVDTSNELVRQIADAESSDQWTLMHRFNKAADLLDQALTVSSSLPERQGSDQMLRLLLN